MIVSRTAGSFLIALALVFPAVAAEPVLTLRAVGVGTTDVPLTIEVFRWSSDAERSPLMAALAAPPPPPAAPPAATEAAGRGGGRAGGGRGGRGGGRGAAAPADPMARLTAAVKAAPTVGFVWGDGVTGYSIKYAWRAPAADEGTERIVLVTDRRLGAHAPGWSPAPGPAVDAEFTVIEMRVAAKGAGEGKTSLATKIGLDATAKTLALEGYQAAPVQLKVSR